MVILLVVYDCSALGKGIQFQGGYRLCLGICAMDNSSNLLIVQNLVSKERIGVSLS